ncbi:MlaE family ABC transporter permease [Actinospongicola halichondriae]|uniref:MlaE family ABC transporter permease n=1 Tax=Actinospongicola halichondriae TaxID=3236844 RepID=UPI003F52C5FF
MAALALEGTRRTWDIRRWWREFLDQCDFLASVTILPVMLVAVPFGAVISLQLGQLVAQLGAQSLTGAAAVTGMIQQIAPIVTALLIAGAGGSAMAADMGARNVRDELAAMEVMAVNPTHRLVTPRLWAATVVGVFLISLVVVAGTAGAFFFNVLLQGVSPGAFFNGATTLVSLPDLVVGLLKAGIFGFVAASVACYRGMTCDMGPVGVGKAVTESVVQTFIAVFVLNYVITALYLTMFPPSI